MQNDQQQNQKNYRSQQLYDSTQSSNPKKNKIKILNSTSMDVEQSFYNFQFHQESQEVRKNDQMNQQLPYQYPQQQKQYGQQQNDVRNSQNEFYQQSNNFSNQQQQYFPPYYQNQQQYYSNQQQQYQGQQRINSLEFSQQQCQTKFQQNTQSNSNWYNQQNSSSNFVEISQNNPTTINSQQIFQIPQVPIQVTTCLPKLKQDDQNKHSCHQLIDYFFSLADIEIKVTNIDRSVLAYFDEIKNNLGDLNLNIQYPTIDQTQYLNENLIYQVYEQPENNISRQEKMTILLSQVIEKFFIEAEKQQVKIKIHEQKCQYKIDSQQQMVATKFYQNFKTSWDSYVVLIASLKSEFEAKQKFKLLKKPRMHELFCKALDVREPIMFLASDINLAFFQKNQIFLTNAMDIKRQVNSIIVINYVYDVNLKIHELQQKLDDFFQNPQIMKNVKETFDIDCSIPKDVDEIDRSIRKLKEQEEQFEIIVTNPISNAQNKGKYLVEAEMQLWIEGDQTEYVIMQKLQAVKKQLYEIYNPNLIIKVTEQDKIKLWNQFLGQEFEKQHNLKECITKQNNIELTIELNGRQNAILEKQQKILQYLEQFKCIILYCQCDKEVALVLQSKEFQFQRLLVSTLIEIAQEFGQCLIKMIEVNQKLQLVVEVYYNQIQYKQIVVSQKIQTFFENLEYQYVEFDFKEFLNFIEMKEISFQETFQVVVSKFGQQPGTWIVGKRESLEEVSSFLFQFNQSKQEDYVSDSIDCDNKLVFNKLKQLQSQQANLNAGDRNVIISFPQENKIMIQAPEKLIKQAKDKFDKQIRELKSQVKTKICDFSDKEIKFIDKNFQAQLEQLKKNNEIQLFKTSQVQVQEIQNSSIACTLLYKNKSIQIIYADISKIQCDAIVNSCNSKMSFGDHLQLSGVAQSIFEMGGTQFQSFCSDYIKKYKELQQGVVCTYKMPAQRQIKYILNVATPIYSKGDQTDDDLKKIEENIKALFKEIKNLDIETVTIPIFGGGACGYSFNQAAMVVLNTTINQLYAENNSIKKIYIAELTDVKIDQLTKILKQLLEPPLAQREIQYQWQWQDRSKFKDYDDEEINKQIDEAYEQFLLTGQEQNILLKFPYSKKPGTHQIDFQNKTVTDISLSTTKALITKLVSNSKKYFFGYEQVDDQLNEYIMIQELSNVTQFDIFYKQHYVIIKQGEMYQMNLETQYKRQIQKTKYQTKKDPSKQQYNYLVDKQYQFQVTQYQVSKLVKQKNNYGQFTVQSFNDNLNETIIKQIKQYLSRETTKLEIYIPNLQEDEIENIQNQIQKTALSSEGKFLSGNKVIIEFFKKKYSQICQIIEQFKSRGKSYPKEWIPQNENYLKVALKSDSEEFKNISTMFKKTDSGTIYEIYRIQNKSLWDNYISEKNKLIQIYQQNGVILSQIETERYLWHGVRTKHPKIIYSGLKEAFDYSYSDVGLWGVGIYFAEKASYSRHYSYKLQKADQQGEGRQVFLCCLITTGKVSTMPQDKNIKRPPQGYDCVSGLSNEGNSNIFVLYSMDVRRAYPAYEIIFS
ncbi:unnamed protein product (macronuclear) [Paramecium tetraurelia]|uniref:Poly [ADP-ribose] polymerase n=1 Tax=Paramecium tetraurelia TaxID=5888 RepID=A0BR94_PARTE|nr:uncharacterized protein GSPATT00031292001 [Paramecium tetraurelia]CAK61061.1 unnamed protein product [Paramecium tetraurelia]|eukprot:XP_001428459.1 hypothetical protein (macronuclear) [Paramecium tetraurelia strain d4-2]